MGSRRSNGGTFLRVAGMGVAIGAVAAIVLVVRDPGPQGQKTDSISSVNLPFTLPCAIDSADSPPLFTAVRNRDKRSLMTMLANKKFIMVKRGTPVILSSRGNTATVDIAELAGDHTCYVPLNMIPVIERELGQ